MQDTQSVFEKLGKNKKKLLAISSVVLDEIKNI